MKSKEELKKLFENGDKPTQENFWEWQDSYWHKDEKLPTENAGLYKVKGSVPDLTALHLMNSMSEGDVYNLLDTGDNYVYVIDLNNTGEAGWDKLGGSFIESFIPLAGTEVGKPLTGMIEVDSEKGLIKKGNTNDPNEYSITLNDFSGVTLESPSSNLVVSNGGVNFSTGGTGNSVNFGINSVSGEVLFNVENANYRANHVINNNTEITELIDKVSNEEVHFIKSIEEGIISDKDFTDVINPLAFVQKKYVDDNTSLQSVLDNGSVATNPNNNNTARIDLQNGNFGMMFNDQNKYSMFMGTPSSYLFTSDDSTIGGFGLALTPNQFYLETRNNPSGEKSKVNMSAEQALYYDNDYSAKFTDRSLVDKAYVDSKVQFANLQSVLENGSSSTNPTTGSNINIDPFFGNFSSNLFGGTFTSIISQNPSNTILSVQNSSNRSEIELRGEFFTLSNTNGIESSSIKLDSNFALQYSDNYSSKFTDRSLVDKSYVDSKTNYTVNEEAIGTWIDGSTIFRKIINIINTSESVSIDMSFKTSVLIREQLIYDYEDSGVHLSLSGKVQNGHTGEWGVFDNFFNIENPHGILLTNVYAILEYVKPLE